MLLLLVALKNVNILSVYISNAYLNSKCDEKVCFRAGPEFKSHQRMWILMVKALHEMRSAEASFRNHLTQALREMGFLPTLASCDVWYQLNYKTDKDGNAEPYYEYICT